MNKEDFKGFLAIIIVILAIILILYSWRAYRIDKLIRFSLEIEQSIKIH
jgi:hypothetical protein